MGVPLHSALYAGHLRVALQLLQHPCSTAAVTALNGVEDNEGFWREQAERLEEAVTTPDYP